MCFSRISTGVDADAERFGDRLLFGLAAVVLAGRLARDSAEGHAQDRLDKRGMQAATAVSILRRPKQPGQKPRRLQLKATSIECAQLLHGTFRQPCSKAHD
jgi:hypothetical protein